jgi:S1-C subfamily serine protease
VNARFRILSGARAGEYATFEQSYVGIGRHPLSDLRFDPDRDLDVSSRHAAVVRKPDGFYLQDLGSTNGTLLNGSRITREVSLTDGDVIGLGPNGPSVEFRLVSEATRDVDDANGLVRTVDSPTRSAPGARSSTATRIALEVARQTRALRLTTKLLLFALVLVAAFGTFQIAGTRARGRELTTLQARADSLVRETAALSERFAGELIALRRALVEAEAETQRLRRELTGSSRDAETLARLRTALEQAELRQRGLAGAAAVDYRAIARRNQDAVAMVLVEFSETERYSGTAFAVDSQGTLVTNKHVLTGENGDRLPQRLGVMFAGSRQNFPARILGIAPHADIAVLSVSVRGGVPRVAGLVADPSAVEPGDPAAMLGFPLGFDLPMARSGHAPIPVPTLTVGTVSKVLPDVLQLDGYGAPGSSGSPVFDRDGRVIGVLYGGVRESQGKIVYAVPGHVIAAFLRHLNLR